MNRREFIKDSAMGALTIPSLSLSKVLAPPSYSWWGLIALFRGATGGAATGIPRIRQRLYDHITFSMGPGGEPCMVAPPCGPSERSHINEMVDPIILIEDYEHDTGADTIMSLQRRHGTPDFLVLIGHSKGGNEVLRLANSGLLRRQADLLVTIDPYWVPGGRVTAIGPGAARNAYNFFTSRGDLGINGYQIQGAKNYDYTDDRCSTSGCFAGQNHEFTHTNIDDCGHIRDRIFQLIQKFFP